MKNTARLTSSPSSSRKSRTRSSPASPARPAASPPTKAEMKPLPPASSASTKASTARASTASRWNASVIISRGRAADQPAAGAAHRDADQRAVADLLGREAEPALRGDVRPPRPPARRRARRRGPTARRSRPASTLRPSLMRRGTSLLVTTGWPSAASVGARTAAIMAASQNSISSSRSAPTPTPRAIVSGIPIPSSLAGSLSSVRSRRRSIRAASEKSRNASATSARTSPAPRDSSPLDEAEDLRPGHDARRDEDQRSAHHAGLEAARDQRVRKHHGRQDSQVVHRGRQPASAAGAGQGVHAPTRPSAGTLVCT